ncbi:MAG TPA: hypothetical protein VNO31_17510, partial [Umezawaea sp.]|nr:hypothetical protein [Umezawaea sp.]
VWVDPADPGRSLRLGVHPSGSEYWTMENALYEGTADHVDLGAKGLGAHTPEMEPGRVKLMWPGDGGEQLTVETVKVPDELAVAKRFAEALESDGGGEHSPVLTLAPEYAERSTSGDYCSNNWTGTSPADWTVEVEVHHLDGTISVRLSTAAPDTTGGEPVRARGVDATFVPARRVGDAWTDVVLVVPVGDRFLVVAGESTPGGADGARLPSKFTEETLVDVATSTKIADHPDVSWFGTR